MSEPNDIILFHYPFSPYARRVIWYLQLRGIQYAQCIQPPVLPRPDVEALGLSYRRIPILALSNSLICDSRLILHYLEEQFPDGRLGAASPSDKALERLLDRWTTDAGVFARAAQLIPLDSPIMKDEKFIKDRSSFTGRPWKREAMEKARAEALVCVRNAFSMLEEGLLADGRDWVLKTDRPMLADIEAIWPFDWLIDMKGALPPSYISETQFPKVYAWVKRFREALKTAKASAPKPVTLKGGDALRQITNGRPIKTENTVDQNDPLGLSKGDAVEVWPIDSGFSHHDVGTLLGLTADEVVLATKASNGTQVAVHMPRWGFRVVRAAGASARL